MREIDPMTTNRAASWNLYHNAPMPMVTIFKTLDLSNLLTLTSKGYKLNMLLCYCIGLAASQTREFRLLPAGDKMLEYDKIGVNVIVSNQNGGINACDIPFLPQLETFSRSYLELTQKVAQTCTDYEIEDHMIIGTSSLVKYEIDGVVNMYSGIFNNPFLIWGKYRQTESGARLQVSFQFHHVQMDGLEACAFLDKLQNCILNLSDSAE